MKKVRMTQTARGSIDGVRLLTFDKGQVYRLPDDLAEAFVKYMKVGEIVMEQPVMKFEVPEKSYKLVTLKDKPKKWDGLEIREKATGKTAKIIQTAGGQIFLDNGEHPHFKTVRAEWELM